MPRSLQLTIIKFDRALIDPVPAADPSAVVTAIRSLAKVLDPGVVAEDVETTRSPPPGRGALEAPKPAWKHHQSRRTGERCNA